MEACSDATLAVRTSELVSAVESTPLAELMVAWSLSCDAGAVVEDPGETPELLAAAQTPAVVDNGAEDGVEEGAEGDGVATVLLAIWA
jgi:hypothetical protein